MDWLITTKANTDMEQLLTKLSGYGCKIADDLTPVPLGANEQVIEVTGPNNLPEKIVGDDSILGIFPNSELTLYDD